MQLYIDTGKLSKAVIKKLQKACYRKDDQDKLAAIIKQMEEPPEDEYG